MGIYTRDQIQYANMIQNAMQNRARAIEREGDRIARRGELYGNAFNQSGQIVKDSIYSIAQQKLKEKEAEELRNFQTSEAEKRAIEQFEAQEAQRKWQEEQNRLQRESTEKISETSRNLANEERVAELTKQYNISSAKLRNLRELSAKDPNNGNLKLEMAIAEQECDFYRKKLGIEDPTVNESNQSTKSSQYNESVQAEGTSLNNSEIVKNVYEILNDDKWTNAAKRKALDLAGQVNDDAIKMQLMTKIENKKKTVEEIKKSKDAELANAIDNWNKTGTFNNNKFKIKISNGVSTLVWK